MSKGLETICQIIFRANPDKICGGAIKLLLKNALCKLTYNVCLSNVGE